MIAGIDEAGRGPVIGPMVMAIAAIDPAKQVQLTKMGVRDSKLVPKDRRERLARELAELLPHEIIAISAAEIDAVIDGDSKDNLNRLEARTSARLIHGLAQRIVIERVIIDSPQKSADKYEALVRDELDRLGKKKTRDIVLQCEIKADLNHPIVGAASILAKVTRDGAIAALEEEHGTIGSGYMTDPNTQEFLNRTWKEGHEFFRKSWASFKRLQDGAGQARLGDFSDEHREIIKEFERLKEHGFDFVPPTNPYEVLRMKDGKSTIIRYTTGKVVVQGPAKEKSRIEKLLPKH